MITYHHYEGHLNPTPPYAFEHSLAFRQGRPPAAGPAGAAPLTDALLFGDRPVAWRLRSPGKVESPLLSYELFSLAPLSAADCAAVGDRIRFYLSLDDDLQPFYTLAWDDDAFAAVVDRLYGYHQVKFITPFAAAVWAILTQRTAWSTASRQRDALIQLCGAHLTIADEPVPAFPSAAAAAAASPNELARCAGSDRRGAYLQAAAVAFAAGDESWLRTAPAADVRQWLLAIDGVGPWSAELILLRGLGRREAGAAAANRRFLAAARRVYGSNLTAEAISAIGARYGDWQGYWLHYLRFAARE